MSEEQTQEGFWSNVEAAQEHSRQMAKLKRLIEPWEQMKRQVDDAKELIELSEMEDDPSEILADIDTELGSVEAEIPKRRVEALLRGPYDDRDAFITVHSRAGGLDAQDWAEMLVRMYSRWSEEHGHQLDVIEYTPAEGAGIKSATLKISGPQVYGYLRGETGVHRLVRIGPFDAAKRRHTAFALASVLPVLDDTIEIKIDPTELRVETYRSSGAGGQHVNKTDSAVRLTHLPTGIVVQCQNERSQIRNRESALAVLKAKLFDLEERKRREERKKLRGEHSDESWGHQIRSYVLVPYTLVKDLRTEHERGDVARILDGDIDSFLSAYLEWNAGNE